MEKYRWIQAVCLIFIFLCDSATARMFTIGEQNHLESQHRFEGRLKPKYIAPILCPFSGTVVRQNVSFGHEITQNEPLFELDSEELKAGMLQLRANYHEQKLQLNELLSWQDSLSMQQARLNLKKAQEQLNITQRHYDRTQILWQEGIIPQLECEREKQAFEQAKDHLDNMQNLYDNTLVKGSRQYIDIQKMKVQQLYQQLSAQSKRYAKRQIHSPIPGKLIRHALPSQGQTWVREHPPYTCQENEILGFVYDDQHWQVLVTLSKNANINMGEKVVVIGESIDTPLTGIVHEVVHLPEFDQQKKHLAEVIIDLASEQVLDINQTVTIVQQKREMFDYLIIPISAIHFDKQSAFVCTTEPKAARIDIVIKRSDHHFAAVTGKLTKGDTIVVPD